MNEVRNRRLNSGVISKKQFIIPIKFVSDININAHHEYQYQLWYFNQLAIGAKKSNLQTCIFRFITHRLKFI